MRFRFFGAIVFAGAILMMLNAHAQLSPKSPEWQTCTGKPDAAWDKQIESCTLLIGTPTETTQNRAVAYIRRGIAHNNKGEFDRAIADYTDAIQTDSNSFQAYYNRANVYWSQGENDKAIQDFSTSLQFNPRSAAAHRGRGLAYYYSGHTDEAFNEIGQAHVLDPADVYTDLWLDITAQAVHANSHLSQITAQFNKKSWPGPVIQLFLGETTPAAVLTTADNANAAIKTGQVCEANFYSGEWSLRIFAKEEAARQFKLAADGCPKDFLEWAAANAELKLLSTQE